MVDPCDLVSLPSRTATLQRLTLGLGPLGNLYKAVSEADAQSVLDSWWRLGLRTFDVAPLYGYGIAEERLGRFLAGRVSSSVVVSTKVGRPLRLGPPADRTALIDGQPLYRATPPGVSSVFDFSAAGVRASLMASLERLQLQRLDIVYIHDPDRHLTQALGEGARTLADLRSEGLVGAIGVGTTTIEAALAFVRDGPIDCLMLAGRYTLLDQAALDELLPLCLARGIGVVNCGVLNSGFLADPHIGARYDYEPTSDEDLVDRAQRIRNVCKRHGVPLLAAAIQFSATHPAVVSVAVGAGSVAHAIEAFDMYRRPIPEAVWDELKEEELIRADVPTRSV